MLEEEEQETWHLACNNDTIASAPREEVQETQNVKIIVKTYLGMCFKV